MTPYIGEIRILPYNFTPVDWVACDGQLLPISNYNALYSIIGTTYGGNGYSDFALPDLRGRVPMSIGQGPGLTNRSIGQMVGTETVTLTETQLPQHNHRMTASTDTPTTSSPVNALAANGTRAIYHAPDDPSKLKNMDSSTIRSEGGNQPHTNMAPFLAMQFCICVNGLYPNFS